MKTCLIVIDAQESFRHRPYFDDRSLMPYLAAQNALIAGFVRRRGARSCGSFTGMGRPLPDNPFALESGHVRPIEGLAAFEAAATLHQRAP